MNGNRAIAILMVVFVAFLFVPIPAQAGTTELGAGMSAKLKQGVINTLTGFIEVPAQTIKGAKAGIKGIDYAPVSHPLGTVVGMVRGVHQGAGRTLSGVQDTAGFWAANPMSNEGYGIPFDAEYAWEEGTQFQIFEPNLGEGLKPMGKKLVRGSGDAIFSFMEIPGQINLGIKNDNVGSGMIKGLYFGVSRLYTGATDAALFALPNSPDTVGFDYEQPYPWDALKGVEANSTTMTAKETSMEMAR